MTQNHLTPGELAAYDERRLPPSELLAASDHLAECEHCRTKLLQLADPPVEKTNRDGSPTLSYEELTGWLNDELDPMTRRDVAATLARSAQARAELADLTKFRNEMNALPPRDYAGESAPAEQSAPVFARWVFPLAAAVLLSGAAIWWMTHREVATQYVTLRDDGRVLAFTEDGRSPALTGLPRPLDESVAETIRTGRINVDPQTAGLAGQIGTLAGADEQQNVFRVLAPIATAVADAKPRFRWTPAAGASGYRINILEETSGAVIVSERVSAESTEWAPAEPLPRGEVYQWEVQALRDEQVIANTPAPPQPEARFRILGKAALAELQEATRASSGSQFAMGVANARAGLIDDALRNFRSVAAENPDSELLKQVIAQIEAQRAAKP